MPIATLPSRRPSGPDARTRRATRWAVGVLGLATAALLLWSAAAVAAAAAFAVAYESVSGQTVGPVDLVGVTRSLAPGLLAGWCCGMAAAAALGPGEGMGPRTAGILSGALGVLAALVVLHVGGAPIL